MRDANEDVRLLSPVEGAPPCGVSLGYGRCSEHEDGISRILALLGVQGDAIGINRFRVRKTPPTLTRIEGKDGKGTLYSGFGFGTLFLTEHDKKFDFSWGPNPIQARWDKHALAVVSNSPEGMKTLEALYEGFRTDPTSITLYLGGSDASNPFGRPGIQILQIDDSEYWRTRDAQVRKQHEEELADENEWAKETDGLLELLPALAEKINYRGVLHVHVPLRKKDGSWTSPPHVSRKSDGKLRIFLNASPQDLFQYGWMTAEDLWAWVRGEGPVWPAMVALPPETHRFWETVRESVPPPDKTEDGAPYNHLQKERVRVNAANVTQLRRIPGTSEKTARAIAVDRKQNGPYFSLEEVLARVPLLERSLQREIKKQRFKRSPVHFLEQHATTVPVDWPPFPFVFASDDPKRYYAYLKGNDFWPHAVVKWGFKIEPDKARTFNHLLFRKDRDAATARGLTTYGFVKDPELFLQCVERYIRDSGEPLDYLFFGRGSETLKALLR